MTIDNELANEIASNAEELYKKKYGDRSPSTLSSDEIEKINHEAAMAAQRRRRER